MISVENLVYEYPTGRALNGITLSVEKATITALVGPNGAGKTTLLRCVAGLQSPLTGQIHIGGEAVEHDPLARRRQVGYLPDFFGLYDALTVRQGLLYAVAAQKIPPKRHDALVDQAAGQLGLIPYMDSLAGELSRGLRQRLAIAQALVHEPACLVLDEPASGLDPEARYSLSGLFRSLCEKGVTLLVSSHILSELEDYATHVAVMRGGRLERMQPLSEAAELVRIRVGVAERAEDLLARLQIREGVVDPAMEGPDSVVFFFSRARGERSRLLAELVTADFPVDSFEPVRESLRETYLESCPIGGEGEGQ